MRDPAAKVGEKRERPGWPWWIKLPLALLGAAALASTIILMLNQQARNRWYKYAETLRAAGEPLTLDEIEKLRPLVADDENAALVIERQMPALSAIKVEPREWVMYFNDDVKSLDLFAGVPRYAIEPTRAFVEQHRAILDGLEALRSTTTGRMGVVYSSDNPIMMLPSTSGYRAAGKLLLARAILSVVDGRPDEAVDDLELAFRASASMDGEFGLIMNLVGLAMDELTSNVLEAMMTRHALGEVDLRRLERLVQSRRAARGVTNTMRGERAFFLDNCELVVRGRLDPGVFSNVGGPATPSPLPHVFEWVVRDNQKAGAELYGILFAAGEDELVMLAASREYDNRVAALPGGIGGTGTFLVKMLTGSLRPFFGRYLSGNARVDCTLAALAAERFRMTMGRFPAELDELVPEYLATVPRDPFDGQPLRMAVTADGITIYSVGENESDDGGDVAKEDASRSPDVGFRLLRPELRANRITDDPPPGE
ncbi:MAG: hypothetical protein HOP29_06875 [Phycisphaerales bacterium]|nr:hypothetical protein [Phycisphaerales bacterium]